MKKPTTRDETLVEIQKQLAIQREALAMIAMADSEILRLEEERLARLLNGEAG
jgi:hypothetical protein